MLIVMTWKSTSLSGWEYLVVCKDLGLSPMYANYVIFYFCVRYFKSMYACE